MKTGLKNQFMKFKIFRTLNFEEEYDKLPPSTQTRIDLIEKKLINNQFVGRPLGYNFLREKRLNGKRMYFLVYEDILSILLAGISDKKAQHSTIAGIKERFIELNYEIRDKLKEN